MRNCHTSTQPSDIFELALTIHPRLHRRGLTIHLAPHRRGLSHRRALKLVPHIVGFIVNCTVSQNTTQNTDWTLPVPVPIDDFRSSVYEDSDGEKKPN